MKYSDYFVDQLVNFGYTHCFYINGGNIMHLLESARTRMECIAVTHEVSAVIAAEYFNVANRESDRRAVAFVTAGPGLTNATTGIAGAWLESRELLLVGGQARSNLLSKGTVRQVGHQEIDGAGIVSPITKNSVIIDRPIDGKEIFKLVQSSKVGRKGPVFLELCLDVSLMNVDFKTESYEKFGSIHEEIEFSDLEVDNVIELLLKSQRPMFIVGGGLDFSTFRECLPEIEKLKIPIATTWNTADYLDYDSEVYVGRPNTYGMRWANAIIQQSDLLISIGARLGLQQTGFNVEEFAPLAQVVRVDIDKSELEREFPQTELKIQQDASVFLKEFVQKISKMKLKSEWDDWIDFVWEVKSELPVDETCNATFPDYVNPFQFVTELSSIVNRDDLIIPCSSGGAYTTMMQAFKQKTGNLLTNNKGLASMGYGLAGAIGTSIAFPEKRAVLVEGDGGFAQNLQELGTVANQNLNLKMFIFDNGGFASIRISQRSYFSGNYLGCDQETGIGMPDWQKLFETYGIKSIVVNGSLLENIDAVKLFETRGPAAFILKVHKDQVFLPKITSKINNDGTISSNPIHLMNPPLEFEMAKKVFKYLPEALRG